MAKNEIDNICRLIKAGSFSGVKEAMGMGNVNQYSTAGFTPLGTAILCGNSTIAKYLLEQGADIQLGYISEECQEKSSLHHNLPEVCPPIHLASVSGSADLIHLLVDHGADVNDPSGIDYGAQMLPLCLSRGEATKTLIRLGADVSLKNAPGFTPLLYAIAREDIPSARLMVERGADVEAEKITKYRIRVASEDGTEDPEGRLVEGTSSPLMVACHQGRLRNTSAQMIQILVSAGADVNRLYNIKNAGVYMSFTALSLICGSRTPTPVLRGAHANKDQYSKKEVAAIRALIAAGADINNPPIISYLCEGRMPFRDFESRLSVMDMLIRHGVQINPASSLAIQLALLKSFTRVTEAEIQFSAMATALARAGVKWDKSRLEGEVTTLPKFFYKDT
ncbi:ankyrin [Trichoderma arundinaceum]|uniref:Ankyrin n=1 Tax=Trichoderma arundinaceum TaxID=490622 RepID=A0A395P1I4_TRIAR|nr:ankyrin [Trichoderma arundinaceum]